MTEPDNHLCVIGNRPHPAEAGHLCRGHYGKLADTIRDIVLETEQLSAVPSMAISHGGKGGNLASHRAPARLDVLTLTDRRRNPAGLGADWDHTRYDDTPEVLDTLSSWARIVIEDRQLINHRAGTITEAAQTLSKHLDWISAQAWVDEAYDEFRKLLTVLKRTNGDPDDRPIGKCYLPQHDGICNGPIWLDTIQAIASCGHCGERWTGTQLAHLNWEMEMARRPKTGDGRDMVTAQEMQELANAPRTKVNVWIHRARKAGHQDINGYWDSAAVIPAQKLSAG